jgi:ADP-ribose pyrophosphatase YjhB (NUDIX family)
MVPCSADLLEGYKETGNCTLKIMISIFYKFIYSFLKIYWFIFRPETRGVICLILSGDELLLIRHTYGHSAWTLSGGGFKKHETKEEAVKREVKEELGINITPEYMGEFTHRTQHKTDTVSCFVARIEKIEPKIDRLEIKEAKWWNINSLPKNHSMSLQRVILMHKSR